MATPTNQTTANTPPANPSINKVQPSLWTRVKRKIWKWLLIFLCLVIAVLAFFTYASFSEGSRAGTLIKLSKKGYVFKTWEGELSQNMYVGDLAAASATLSIWEFSVNTNDTNLINTLNNALLNGKRVKLDYKQKYITFPWQGETKYYINKVEVMK